MKQGCPLSKLPRGPFISLTTALTQLAFRRSMDTPELIAWIENEDSPSTDEAVASLTVRWQELADVACDGSIAIWAKRRDGRKFRLGVDDLRTYRYVALGHKDKPILLLSNHGSDFEEAFRARARELDDDLVGLETHRDTVKVVRMRRSKPRQNWTETDFQNAIVWLRKTMEGLPREPGSKGGLVRELERRFRLPTYRAEEVWKTVADELDWPRQGRPKKSKKKMSELF